jgi:histidinol-phosphate aminotransferase
MKAKDYVAGLRVYEPGRPIEEVARELGFEGVADMIKVASNENELGPSPKAIEAMRRSAPEMHRYPDGGAFYLKAALADRLGVLPENLLFGCGSNELIVFLCHLFLGRGTNLVMGSEAFAVYFLAAAMFEGDVVRVPMPEHVHDLEGMLRAITQETRLVVVCNPNNPTGTWVTQEALDGFVAGLPDHVVAVFDEAYFEVMPYALRPDLLKYVRGGRDNVVVLRTFSKGYGLAGLRIGYAVGSAALIGLMNKVRQPFNVSAMAQSAALAALEDEAHLDRTLGMVREGIAFFEAELGALGLEVVPSAANFVLVKSGNGRAIFEALQRKKVIVRPMDPYGLPDYIRITVGTEKQNRVMLEALKALLG